MKKIIRFLTREGIGVFIILVLLFILMSIISPYFLTVDNISNLLLQSVFVMLVSFGMMFVLTAGGIDLSVGSVLGLCGGVTGWFMMMGLNMWLAILLGILLGALIGAINGFLVTKVKIAPFLVTFSMLTIARGLLMVATIDQPITNFATSSFEFIAQGYFLGIPMPVWITAIVFILSYFLFNWTSFGRNVVAVGSNEEAAKLSGVNTDKVKIWVYTLAGVLASISGIILASRLTSVQPEMGRSYEMQSIAAAVVGGTSMSGGKGSIAGTAIGAVILAMVSNALDLLSVNQFYRMVITGLIIIIAVTVDGLRKSSADTV